MRKLPLICLLFWLLASSAWGRGGGGCLAEGTVIDTPTGPRAIETLHPGDAVWSPTPTGLQRSIVASCYRVEPDEMVRLELPDRVLLATPEHPVEISAGVFRCAGDLQAGDHVWGWQSGRLQFVPVVSVTRGRTTLAAYNLLVSPAGTFLADGVAVHNKGCFLPDTPVLLADGSSRAISTLRSGDVVLAFKMDGSTIPATVRNIVTHEVDEYWEVSTAARQVRVTAEHPFYVGAGTFKTIAALHVGDIIYVYDGQGLNPQPIVGMKRVAAKVQVYNLQIDFPNTYFADGFAVHNKGGGGGGGGHGGGGYHGGYSGSGGGGDDSVEIFFVVCIYLGYVVIAAIVKNHQQKSENLDFLFTRAQIARKADKTAKLLEFLAKTDSMMAAAKLQETARATFLKLQDCWQNRAYTPMKPLLTDHLYAEHTAEIAGMVRNHEINKMAALAVEQVDIVNVRYTEDPDRHEFTALITAHARDFYEDDRTGRFLRGDEEPARFQEFWIFQFFNGAWRLREIEQSRESDALKTENFFEQFTDTGVKNIYGDQAAAQSGPSGPWQGKAVADKATRIERMLNFLVKTDKLWDRQRMLDRARAVFVQVISVREGGDPAQVPDALLFPEVAAHLRADISANQQAGRKVEFRNLCVRKVEIILVRNFADNSRDEYVVRISAHAQRCTSQGGSQTVLDDFVTPFTEYWTFGRLDRDWKLKEVLPPAEGEKDVTAENLDEDSSPQQVQWYYSQTRAN